MICASCGGTAHPATGCQYTETCIVCGPCVRRFWHWVKGHTNQMRRVGPRGSKVFVSFYEAIAQTPTRTHVEQLRVITAETAVAACRARQSDEDYLWADVYNAAHANHMAAYWHR